MSSSEELIHLNTSRPHPSADAKIQRIMSEISYDEKEILVLCGCHQCTDIEFDLYLQLYDVEEKKWYTPFLLSADNRHCERSDCVTGIVGSELYFYAELTPREPVEDDEPVENEIDENEDEIDASDKPDKPKEYLRACHCLDFLTKNITYLGNLPYLRYPQIVIDDLIYSFEDNVPCLNTKNKSVSNSNPDELKVYYANGATVLYDGCIYGIQNSLSDFCDFEFISHNMNTKENKILTKPPVVEEYLTMVLFNCKLFAVDNWNLKYLYIYTPEMDEWETVETLGPAIEYCRLITCNDRLLCVENNYRIYEYDFDKKEWNLHCDDYKGPIKIPFNFLTVKRSVVTNWE